MQDTVGFNSFIGIKFGISCSRGNEFDCVNGVKDRFKVILMDRGSCIVKSEAERIALIPPSLILLDEESRIEAVEKEGIGFTLLSFHPNFMNCRFDFDNIRSAESGFSLTEAQDAFLFNVFLKKRMTVISNIGLNLSHAIGTCVSDIEKMLALQEHPLWPCYARCYLIEFLFYLTHNLENARDTPVLHTKVENESPSRNGGLDIDKIILFLNLNHGKKMSIAKIAEAFGTNRTTLSMFFKKATGLPLKNYVSKLRIQIAASMLQNSKVDVSEIMERVGYNDPSHFLKTFKKLTGFTPTDYRRTNTWITWTVRPYGNS